MHAATTPQGPGWWQASDQQWYPPELHPDHQTPPPYRPEPAVPGADADRPPEGHVAAGGRNRWFAAVVAGVVLLLGLGGLGAVAHAQGWVEDGTRTEKVCVEAGGGGYCIVQGPGAGADLEDFLDRNRWFSDDGITPG